LLDAFLGRCRSGGTPPVEFYEYRLHGAGLENAFGAGQNRRFITLHVDLEQVDVGDLPARAKVVEADGFDGFAVNAAGADKILTAIIVWGVAVKLRGAGLPQDGDLMDMQAIEIVQPLGLSQAFGNLWCRLKGVNYRILSGAERGQAINSDIGTDVEYHRGVPRESMPSRQQMAFNEVSAEEIELALQGLVEITRHTQAAVQRCRDALAIGAGGGGGFPRRIDQSQLAAIKREAARVAY
jgi:hypothetical protein